ncbi:MAG: toll/interleukin-1 receptor domain-containing protein [Gammaproteobacteria bacterium]
MANPEHLSQLEKGVNAWNEWVRIQRIQGAPSTRHVGSRVETGSFWADLAGADLRAWDLYQGKQGGGSEGIDLVGADLRNAKLFRTNLAWANLTGASFADADLEHAALSNSRLHGANMSGARLTDANLAGANLLMANLRGCDLSQVNLYETTFADSDLTGATGLESCVHSGPSTIDHRTLFSYGPLPEAFLRGCGLSDQFISYIPSLRSEAIAFYTCFISHSSRDAAFVQRLHADLQAHGVRCWFASDDLRIGDRLWDAIDSAIRIHDKLLLVCSENSIDSEWVEDEVTRAYALERERRKLVLFPIRIDNAVMSTDEAWASKLRHSRHIGDFTAWKDHDAYQTTFARLLRDLRDA